MSEGMDRVREWCEAADLPCQDDDGTLLVRLDPDDVTDVHVELDDEDALRFHDTVPLAVDDLPADRLAEVVEDVVLSRSSLVDARPVADHTGAEVVLVVHAEGLNRHTFLEAVFELQKVRLLLHREVAAAIAAERTVATLAAMADQAWAVSA
jgi:hypothetical protein